MSTTAGEILRAVSWNCAQVRVTVRWTKEGQMKASPQPPPQEAALIRARRESPPKMSIRQAAMAAAISETRWRQIEAGGDWNRGRWEPATAPAQTLARMAAVVGVTAAELTRAGRPDAAAELEALPPRNGGGDGAPSLEDLVRQVDELKARVAEYQRNQTSRKGQADGSGKRNAV